MCYRQMVLALALVLVSAHVVQAAKRASAGGKSSSGGSSASSTSTSGQFNRGGYVMAKSDTYQSSGYIVRQSNGAIYSGAYSWRFYPVGAVFISGHSNVGLQYKDRNYYEACKTAYAPMPPPSPPPMPFNTSNFVPPSPPRPPPPPIALDDEDFGDILDNIPPAPPFTNTTITSLLTGTQQQYWANFNEANSSMYNTTGYYLTDCNLTYISKADTAARPMASAVVAVALVLVLVLMCV